MGSPYVGEIRMFAGNFAPNGWAICDGSLVAIAENTALFSLIGTTYGGDGQSTFALPDLRGRVPIHQGNGLGLTNRTMGEVFGTETHTLSVAQIATHQHVMGTAAAADTAKLSNGYLAPGGASSFAAGAATTTLAASTIGPVGANQAHENMAPFVAVHFIISLFGIYPSQN